MRKRIDTSISRRAPLDRENWVDLENEAEVEITSEETDHPIEAALLPGTGSGWRASEQGIQTIRIRFDAPKSIAGIHLVFTEEHVSRTQEFVLRWSAGEDQPMREVLRQQYNFAPVSSEVEDYTVSLKQVKTLELEINPSINDPVAYATLTELRIRGEE
jgi:hypothetical protein